jgi:5-methylcytosine-specific restriction enzyme subunit McrC
LLLHPAINGDFDESVVIQGHRMRFATVDLAGSHQLIRDRLLGLVTGT